MTRVTYGAALVAVVALVLWTDRSPSDVANQATLAVLLLGAGLLGYAAPRRAWVAGVVVGASIAMAHAIGPLVGPPLHGPSASAGLVGVVSLLLLVVPGVMAAQAGAALRRARRRSTGPPTGARW